MTISDEGPFPENPICVAYCDRLAACWFAMPSADPTVSESTVRASCLAEQRECRTPTTEALCCEELEDCRDFARCQAKGHDAITDCRRSLAPTAG